MIISVCLNPSVDVALKLDKLHIGQINRTGEVLRVAGGKGNNVARVIKVLGEDITVVQLLGGADGEFIGRQLQRLGIISRSIAINQPTRRCIAIIDREAITEVRESGPVVNQEEYRRFKRLFTEQLSKAKLITASGSLPLGIGSQAYAELIKIAHHHKIPLYLDAKGEALRQGVAARPALVKINQTELAEWLGWQPDSDVSYWRALRQLQEQGIKIAIVSLGRQGMIANWAGSIYRVTVPDVAVVSTVGCGDAAMAGLAVGYLRNRESAATLRMAAAAGTAAALQAATGIIEFHQYQQLLDQVQVQLIS